MNHFHYQWFTLYLLYIHTTQFQFYTFFLVCIINFHEILKVIFILMLNRVETTYRFCLQFLFLLLHSLLLQQESQFNSIENLGDGVFPTFTQSYIHIYLNLQKTGEYANAQKASDMEIIYNICRQTYSLTHSLTYSYAP